MGPDSYSKAVPLPLVFHESQYPQAVQTALLSALHQGRVPGRFLYDSPGQAARWLAYHAAWSPSRTQTALSALYAQAFEAVWTRIEGPATLVGVGCGGGQKDAALLAKGPRSTPLSYVAADTSPALVMRAGQAVQAARPDVRVRHLVVDLGAEPTRDDFLEPASDGPVIWSCLGLLPNLDAAWLLPYVRGLMKPQDTLLISANLSPVPYPEARPRIRPQYDNPEARAWYQGALDELGLGAHEAELVFSDRALMPNGQAWRLQCHAVLSTDRPVRVFSETVSLQQGQRLEVFHSDRYVPEVLPGLLLQHGLHVEDSWVTEDREEGIYLCQAPSA